MAELPPSGALPRFAVAARFFDGVSAGERLVRAEADEASGLLRIVEEGSGALLQAWPLAELRTVRDPGFGDGIVFFRDGHDEARLNVQSAEDAAALAALAPNLRRVRVAKGTWRRVVLWSAGSAGALALLLLVILPGLAENLAGLVPPKREEAMGRQVVAQMERVLGSHQGSGVCRDPAGLRALQKMSDRLTAGLDLPYPLKLQVLRHPMVNAFATPGGHVVIVSGLLEAADSPEEVAGVLAHEIGHVANRDPLRIALRTAGSAGILSMVFGDFAGGTVVVLLSEQLMRASYTRKAEAAADDFAFALLEEAGLPSEGVAVFFDKLKDRHGDVDGVSEYLSSHPNLASRAAAARRAETQGGGGFTPVLSAAEWQDLQGICR